MDIHPHIAGPGDGRLSRVKPHPDAHGRPIGPLVCLKCALRLECTYQRVGSTRERHEERVALGIDLEAVALGERCPQQIALIGQDRRISLPQALEEQRGALDVREQEGHGPGRKGVGPFLGPDGCRSVAHADFPLRSDFRRLYTMARRGVHHLADTDRVTRRTAHRQKRLGAAS